MGVDSRYRHTQEAVDQALAMHADGLRPREIAEKTGVPENTVRRWLKTASSKATPRPVEVQPRAPRKTGPTIIYANGHQWVQLVGWEDRA